MKRKTTMNSDTKLLAFYGLKYNPFLPDIPVEDLWRPPGSDGFFSRVALLVRDGGFVLIYGDTGVGKSKMLHLLDNYLDSMGDVVVGIMERPQSSLTDFYRELGDLFGVNLTPANRYGGFKALRARWRSHMKSTLWRPVLLVDEAQESKTACLNELRSLSSARFDSQCLLTTVLCGDRRLAERFRDRDLLPLGSRIRVRCLLDPLPPEELGDFLRHTLEHAGAPHLMTVELQHALCEHAAGNLRLLTNMAADLLAAGLQKELAVLDDKLFFEVFSPSVKPRRKKNKTAKNNR
jgi:type II secretory pathway predicted ATPase ExeA